MAFAKGAPSLFNIFFAVFINRCDLHAFQGGQIRQGRFGASEEEKGGGGEGRSNCRRASPSDAALGHALR